MTPDPTHPEREAPVFVLGAARSGTTLVQRVLNSYADILVWGEHAGFLDGIAASYYRGLDTPDLFQHARPLATILADSEPGESWQAWMTWLERDQWTPAFRRLVEVFFVPGGLPGKRRWGFKEIRYQAAPGDRTLDFLHALYPDALFVFTVRNPLNVVASSRRRPTGPRTLAAACAAAGRWRLRYDGYRAWAASRGARAFWVVYEDLIAERGAMLDVLAALGKDFGDAQRAVLQSEGGRGSSFRGGDTNERWRALPFTWRMALQAILAEPMRSFGYPTATSPLVRHVLFPPLAALGRTRWLGGTSGA